MIYAYISFFVLAFLLSVAVCYGIRRIAPSLGLVDKPGERKIHTMPIPTGGGLGIWFGVLFPLAVAQIGLFLLLNIAVLRSFVPETVAVHLDGFGFRSAQLWTLLGLGSLLVLLGTLDDRFNLSWKLRLGVQTLVAASAVFFGWRLTNFDATWLNAALSVFWIVGLINSFNMLDNMNGLSAGVAAICTAFLAAVMMLSPNPESMQPQFFVAGILIVLFGALAGFLYHNNPFRATMFMGDGGAYFIGFLLATLTLKATFAGAESRQTLFVPLLILAVPLYDTMTVVLIRLRNGKSPFVGDKNHFSHRLVDLGLSKTQAVLTVYLATAICCLGALLMYQVDFFGASLIFFQTVLVLLLVAIIEHTGRNK